MKNAIAIRVAVAVSHNIGVVVRYKGQARAVVKATETKRPGLYTLHIEDMEGKDRDRKVLSSIVEIDIPEQIRMETSIATAQTPNVKVEAERIDRRKVIAKGRERAQSQAIMYDCPVFMLLNRSSQRIVTVVSEFPAAMDGWSAKTFEVVGVVYPDYYVRWYIAA